MTTSTGNSGTNRNKTMAAPGGQASPENEFTEVFVERQEDSCVQFANLRYRFVR
jgi:hypothetical protein